MKYLGVYINCKTNCIDPSAALRKFFGSFNNIMSVLGHGRDELLAVRLLKTYCMVVKSVTCLLLTYIYKVNVAWSNCFGKIFNACWRESAKPLLYHCNTVSASLGLLIDQTKILFL